MKKLMILLLIAFSSCSESETFEPTEPEPICYQIIQLSNGTRGDSFFCDARVIVTFVEKSKYDSGNWFRSDETQLCVTNTEYDFSYWRNRRVFCENLDILTN